MKNKQTVITPSKSRTSGEIKQALKTMEQMRMSELNEKINKIALINSPRMDDLVDQTLAVLINQHWANDRLTGKEWIYVYTNVRNMLVPSIPLTPVTRNNNS